MDRINELISEGIRKGFSDGNSKMANRTCYGYKQDVQGNLVINEHEAKNVLSIFELYILGYSLGKIADFLFEKGVQSPTGKPRWNREAIDKLLSNEKYIGDALLQKTFVSDGRQVNNTGELKQHVAHNNHPPIITKELFEEVQTEKFRRTNITRSEGGSERKATKYNSGYALSGLIICSECGGVYRRITRSAKDHKEIIWRCSNRVEQRGQICKGSPTITDQEVKEFLQQKFKVAELDDQVIRKKVRSIIVGSTKKLSIIRKDQEKDMTL